MTEQFYLSHNLCVTRSLKKSPELEHVIWKSLEDVQRTVAIIQAHMPFMVPGLSQSYQLSYATLVSTNKKLFLSFSVDGWKRRHPFASSYFSVGDYEISNIIDPHYCTSKPCTCDGVYDRLLLSDMFTSLQRRQAKICWTIIGGMIHFQVGPQHSLFEFYLIEDIVLNWLV